MFIIRLNHGALSHGALSHGALSQGALRLMPKRGRKLQS